MVDVVFVEVLITSLMVSVMVALCVVSAVTFFNDDNK